MREITITSGVYFDNGRDFAIRIISELADDKSWDVVISEHKKDRTEKQNNTLWGVGYKALADQCGYDKEDLKDMHRRFCGAYFGWRWKTKRFGKKRLKEKVPYRTTTTNEKGKRDVLNTEEMAKFYSFVQRFCSQFDVYIPDPREVL